MRYLATVHAVDVMDTISTSVSIRAQNNSEADWRTLFTHTSTVAGVGEDQPLEWLRDALIALLEEL